MAHGKFAKSHSRRASKRRGLLILALVLLVTVSAGGTIAYLMTNSDPITNTFTPAQVSCSVNQDLSITNTSDVPAYIRASVIVTWMDKDGNVCGSAPSYTIVPGAGWSEPDDAGIYYYGSPVNPKTVTDNSNTIPAPATVTCTSDNPNEKIYTFTVEVVAEAIQAEGMGTDVDTAQEAWTKAAPGN